MPNKKQTIRIGGAAGFWGDTEEGPRQLIEKGNLDYLVFDYLAEITMSILARMRAKSDKAGYATDFINPVMKKLLQQIVDQDIKVISNAGGVNPLACKAALEEIAKTAGIDLKIAVVTGDDLLDKVDEFRQQDRREMETGAPLPDKFMSVNAYLGALPIVAALEEGAQVVITGRCVDSACTLAPLMHEFGWATTDYDQLALGSLAGHLIECGAQVNGGIFTDWEEIGEFDEMGFPIVECHPDGHFFVTKPEGTGGLVSYGTVAEQMIYEINDPCHYLLPDVVCDFSQVNLEESGKDLVKVTGATGSAPTQDYKVSATWQDGYRATSTVTYAGGNAGKKAQTAGEAILRRTRRLFEKRGLQDYSETSIEVIGAESMYGKHARDFIAREVMLKTAVRHPQKEAIQLFAREIAPAATSMTPGMTGFFAGRPNVVPVIRLFSFLISKSAVPITMICGDVEKTIEIPIGEPLKITAATPQQITAPTPADDDIAVPLGALAWARSGDKGNHANIGIIARKANFQPIIERYLTEEVVADWFEHFVEGNVKRFALPGVNAFNFMLYNALGGGGIASLRIDPQAKAYGQILLDMQLPLPAAWVKENLPEQLPAGK
ncbi:MAG: terpene utilization protein AtuA [Gammaproteobacteria bacterium]|nr:MAG: terpene utilization protein AtuA [Gammaproteobacteria bacterium]